VGLRDAVTLSTFHRAKGLQWPAVAVVGIEDGMVPIAYARTPEAVAEERRLLYVAITRAEDELWCSWAAERRGGARSWHCDPSPFVADLVAGDGPDAAGRRGDQASTPVGSFTEQISRLRARLTATG
jgi:DNA helicase-2/ATP-dependent DNA helicase PcrA